MPYYKVKVKETTEIEDTKGNIKEKKINNNYLIEALSVTEAETLTIKFIGLANIEVKAVREEKLKAVILKEKE